MVQQFDVITLFPDMVYEACSYGVIGRAVKNGLLGIDCWTPRDYTQGAIDDHPFGGDHGMVMMAEPLKQTLEHIKKIRPNAKSIYLSPQGIPITQQLLGEQHGDLILLCGRYKGIDERLLEDDIDAEWSLGNFVISGGEIAAMAIIDGISRLIPGILGNACSARQDSFMDGLLDCPNYTRPAKWRGRLVPPVLLSGHHHRIRQWRLKQSLGKTWLRRPDLLVDRPLSDVEKKLLDEFMQEHRGKQHDHNN